MCACVCDDARILTFLKEAINDYDDDDDDDDDSDDDNGFSLHSMVIPFRIHIYLVKCSRIKPVMKKIMYSLV